MSTCLNVQMLQNLMLKDAADNGKQYGHSMFPSHDLKVTIVSLYRTRWCRITAKVNRAIVTGKRLVREYRDYVDQGVPFLRR